MSEVSQHSHLPLNSAIKVLHKDEGFCCFSGLAGVFNGGGEDARVYLGDDGYWYLHSNSGRDFMVLEATAR